MQYIITGNSLHVIKPQLYTGATDGSGLTTVNSKIFGVKVFSDTSKNPKIKNTEIFQWYLFIAKRANTVWISFVENVQQQIILSWWQLNIDLSHFEAPSRTAPPLQ